MNHRFGIGWSPDGTPRPSSDSGYSGYSSLRRRGTTSRTPRRGKPNERGTGSSPYSGGCGRIGGNKSGGGAGSFVSFPLPGSGLNSLGGSGGSSGVAS